MAAQKPLTGIELIDCAKANAKQGAETAANLCGYGQNIANFQAALQQAGQQIGIDVSELSDLITDEPGILQTNGIEVAPDTPSDL